MFEVVWNNAYISINYDKIVKINIENSNTMPVMICHFHFFRLCSGLEFIDRTKQTFKGSWHCVEPFQTCNFRFFFMSTKASEMYNFCWLTAFAVENFKCKLISRITATIKQTDKSEIMIVLENRALTMYS